MLVLAALCIVLALVFITGGILLVRAKNWKPNRWVGHRSARSRSSQELWIKANRFLGWCLMVCALPVLVVAGFAFVFMAQGKQPVFMGLLFVALLTAEVLIAVGLTERHIRK